MSDLFRGILALLLVVNLGHSQGYRFCEPCISANKPFPEEGGKLKITAETCPQNENSTIVWSMCGEIVGTCVRESCTVDSVENNPSKLKSTFTIKKASIARDSCLVTFKADDLRLKHRITIYKHPEKINVTANGNGKNNSQFEATEPITLEVKTSCMYPQPLIEVNFKGEDYGPGFRLQQKNSDIDYIEENCKVMEVATSTTIYIKPLNRAGDLSVELLYGNYQREIFKLKIENEIAKDTIDEPSIMPIKVEDFMFLCAMIFYYVAQYINGEYKIKEKTDDSGCICDYLQYPHFGICFASKKGRWFKNVLLYGFYVIFYGSAILIVMKLAILKKWTTLEIGVTCMLAVIIVMIVFPYICELLRKVYSVKDKLKWKRDGRDTESEGENIPLT